jgi:hypothetical protein
MAKIIVLIKIAMISNLFTYNMTKILILLLYFGSTQESISIFLLSQGLAVLPSLVSIYCLLNSCS